MDYSKILNGDIFEDGKSRVFIPYKGWNIQGQDGELSRDNLTLTNEGPLKIIPDPLSHGNWHTLYNLLDSEGNKILPQGVRHVKYFEEGYYLLEDNNEDELINRGDVKGGFSAKDYIERANILFDDGHLLSQEWFDRIIPSITGYFKIQKDGHENYIDYSGAKFSDISHNIIGFDGNAIYTCKDGIICRRDKEDNISIKKLKKFAESGEFRIGRYPFNLTGNDDSALKKFLSNLRSEYIIIDDISSENGRFNLLTKDGYLIFDEWYELIIRYYENYGLLSVKKDNVWKLINIFEQLWEEKMYDLIQYTNSYIVGRNQGKLDLISPILNKLEVDFDSIMWADKGVWGMNVYHNGETTHYFNGQGGLLISYAHEILISQSNSLIIGKNGLWYFYNGKSNPIPLFRYSPNL